jgi:LPXTG-site transpeptidase (sortase) family protein
MLPKKDSSLNKKELVKLYRKALTSDFPLEKLDEKVSRFASRSAISQKREKLNDSQKKKNLFNQLPKLFRVGAAMVPVVFIIVGLLLVGSATVPILGYYVNTVPGLKTKNLTTPIPPTHVLDVSPLVIASSGEETDEDFGQQLNQDSGPLIINQDLDYTNLTNWFSGSDLPDYENSGSLAGEVQQYILEIPSLKISNAVVNIGGENLDDSLIHYPGTGLPGKLGAPVIFGHSVLRQFYNPKETNPRRYNSIFSTIMTLKKGEKIYLTVDNVKYTYVVQDKTEVKPEDTYILSQRYDVRQLKLVTCTPEGTYLRRGVVTAGLVKE